jgi:hypothetical protein
MSGDWGRVRIALWVGAVVWLLLLVAGFFAPGGWTWGIPGRVGHMENYVISLWLATLVLAPLLAARAPSSGLMAMRVYALGVLAIVLSTIRGEEPKLLADGPPLVAAAISLGLLLWALPSPSRLWRG